MKGITFLTKSILTGIMLVVTILSLKVQGQTVLISPTGVGGFESGTTFAANGWTVVNAASNIWEVGTAATAYAGSRGVYVANPAGTYAYVTSASTTSHFYRDVAIPAGATSITLSFYWKGQGESGYDRALVFTAPTTVTPVSGTPASSATAIAGATLVWTQPTFTNSTTYTLATMTLPNALAGTTVRLIFTWQNDASLGTSPGSAIDNISLTYNPPCSSTPVPGNTTASLNPVCSGVGFTLTPASVEGGQNYQWQSSADGVTYSNIGGNVAIYTAAQTAATYYQCVVTCTASGSTATSTPIQVTMNNFFNCFCTSSATTTSDMDITKVAFGTINNTSATVSLTGTQGTATGTAGMYSDWRASVPAASVQQGATVSFTSIIGGTAYSHRVDVYFDFNHDGDFSDSGESFPIFAYANPTLPNTTTANITIPLFALTGNTVMRVVCVESTSSSPCGTYSWGETEDYLINITAAPPCAATPNAGTATASIASGCGNTPVTLAATGLTAATGITYQWQSSSSATGPWTDIPGAINSPTYTTTAYATTYYQLLTTCSNSGLSNTTNVVNYNVIPSGCCQVTLSLYDYGSNGWGTSNIKVYAGTTLVGTYTLASGAGPGTYNFSTNSTDSLTIVFAGTGATPGDCYFNVVGPTGIIMVEDYYPAKYGTWHGGYACPQVPAVQTPCYNLGFESGLTGWYGTQGNPIMGAATAATPNYVPQVFGVTVGNNFHLMTAGVDPVAPINKVYTGTYSLKLGNDTTYDIYNGASIEQTFLVTAANTDFSYNYAVVLYDGGHDDYEQPFFEADVIDGNGDPISCGLFQVAAPGLGASFIETSTADVYYKPWTTVSVNLTAYIGQNVTVRFKTTDCSQGAHYGYAYIDCTCAAYGIINPAVICSGQSATLAAPPGAAAYLWSPGGETTSSISVSPTVTTNYTCNITSQGTVPCYFTLNTTVTVNGAGSVTASNDGPICTGAPLNLTSLPAGGISYAWNGPGPFTSTLQNPTIATTTAANDGTYTVVVTFTGGCTASAQTTASVTTSSAASITNNTGSTVLTCTTTSINVTALGGDTFAWSGGATPTTAANSFTTPGAYTVTVSTGGSCISTASITITQNLTPPTATISYTGSPWCTSAGAQSVTLTGTSGGVYTVSPSGLSIIATSGQITPSTSTPGTYTVTYTTPVIGACAAVTATASVTVNAVDDPAFNYNPSTMCQTGTDQSAIITGGATGTFTASPAGLVFLDASTGQIDVSASALNPYTITFNTNGVCPATSTFPITITSAPVATFNYAGPYCTNGVDPSPTFAVGASAGTFSAIPAGLTFVSTSTGQIDVSASAAGVYTVTNNIAAAGGCAAATATNTVTITALPTATIAYSGSPWCTSAGTQTVTLTGTNVFTGGTYTVSPSGLTIDGSSGLITPSSSTAGPYTVTYTIPASGGCAAVTATTPATITAPPTATIAYSGSLWCTSAGTQTVTLTGTNAFTGGVYTVSPSGLTIDGSSGLITPSSSTAGPYTVTYTIPASGGCAAVPTTTSATITAPPTATITYSGSPWCTSAGTQTVTLTGTNAYTGGTYTVSPSGLTIDGSTGLITPSSSTAGPYTVTYTIPASGGCASVIATTPVTITALPTATISYTGSPWCTTAGTQTVTLNGTNAYTGGAYTVSPSGLTINGSSGLITPSSSTAGPYAITYTIPASGGCAAVPATTNVTITALPTAAISYIGSPWCTTAGTQAVTLTGTNAYTIGSYSVSPSGLSVDGSTGLVTPSSSTQGSYTVTYTIPASGGCAAVVATTSASITAPPTVNLTYSGSPWCTSGSSQTATLTGTNAYTGGIYSVSPAGLTINTSTGQITPSTSTAGAYVVTYTTPVTSGCALATSTANVTVTALPTAAISYTGSPWCTSATVQSVTLTGTNAYTGGTYTVAPAGLILDANTGQITPSTSTAGIYTVTYTILASGGCAAVVATSSVTVTALPTAAISYTGSPWCKSATAQSVTLTGTNAYTGGAYSVSPTGLSINATNGQITPSTSTAGAYTVTYTTLASGGCAQVTATASVTVNALPVATAGSNSPICENETLNLTSGAGTGYSWSWSGPSGNFSTNQNPSITGATSTTGGQYTVTVTGTGNCTSTAQTTVVVNTKPTITITPAAVQICQGNDTLLIASGATTYTWTPTLGITPATGATTTAAPTATTTYTAHGTTNGCTDSTTVVVTVINNPTVVVTPAIISICPGEQTTLNATGGTTYNWSPSATLSSATDSSVVSTPTGTITYTVTGTTTGCSDTATATVTIKPLPQLSVAPVTPEICIHNNLTLTATGADTYVWSPDSTLSSNTGNSVIADPLSSCTYQVSGTLNGCKDSLLIPFVVYPLPVIAILANPASGCQPFTTTLSATSTPDAQSYSWTIDGSSYSDPSPTVLFPNSGQYNVSVVITDTNNCVNNLLEPNFITVYPKPTVTFTFTPEVGVVSKPVVFTSSIDAPGSQYIWNFGDDQSVTESTETTTHFYGMTGTLSVTHIYVNEFGCKDTAYLPINVVINLVIPNIFTPNGDGQNDTFVIDGLQNVEGAVMKIYNRWGRKVFESDNYKNDWNGGDFADGVYFYILTLPDTIEVGPFNGSVTLLR